MTTETERQWEDRHWESADGLSLHYRDYAGRTDRPPLLCLPGLTRNARDFEEVADAFAGEWRVIVAEFRGRGDSDYARDPASYNAMQYVDDVFALLDQANIDRAVFVGTSLGGLVTMLAALKQPDRIAGVVLNDIGPDLEPLGLDRIKDYVGQGRSYPTWMHAARALKDSSEYAFPDYEISDWLAMSKRVMCVANNGRINLDYDMKIAEPFNAANEGSTFDFWPAFRALSGRPVLLVRGELSDLLSVATMERMKSEMPDLATVTVPRVGHVPTLGEPEAQSAIADLLGRTA